MSLTKLEQKVLQNIACLKDLKDGCSKNSNAIRACIGKSDKILICRWTETIIWDYISVKMQQGQKNKK